MTIKQKLTSGTVEPEHALRFLTLTWSSVHLALFEAMVAFRHLFASASCLRKA